jgi:FdhD protein
MRMPRPRLSQASCPATVSVNAINEAGEITETQIAGEHPLTVYLDKREIVTLMTLGAAPEALVLGYLLNQHLVRRIEDIAEIQVDWDTNSAAVTTRDGAIDVTALLQKRIVTTGCGQGTMFGDLMDNLDALRLPDHGCLRATTLLRMLAQMRQHGTVYKMAGAVHGCALADSDGKILMFVEDVGRHNAVDAIAGRMRLDDVDGDGKIFYTTGRLTSEMVIKTAQMGIPFLVSRSGMTQMGHALAARLGLTMIARAQGSHYLLYTGRQRFVRDVADV